MVLGLRVFPEGLSGPGTRSATRPEAGPQVVTSLTPPPSAVPPPALPGRPGGPSPLWSGSGRRRRHPSAHGHLSRDQSTARERRLGPRDRQGVPGRKVS